MRPQTRPFTVEIKSQRRAAPASLRREDWLSFLPPDQLPQLIVDDKLPPLASGGKQALREAAKAFGPFGAPVVAMQPLTPRYLTSILKLRLGEFCPISWLPLASRSESRY